MPLISIWFYLLPLSSLHTVFQSWSSFSSMERLCFFLPQCLCMSLPLYPHIIETAVLYFTLLLPFRVLDYSSMSPLSKIYPNFLIHITTLPVTYPHIQRDSTHYLMIYKHGHHQSEGTETTGHEHGCVAEYLLNIYPDNIKLFSLFGALVTSWN